MRQYYLFLRYIKYKQFTLQLVMFSYLFTHCSSAPFCPDHLVVVFLVWMTKFSMSTHVTWLKDVSLASSTSSLFSYRVLLIQILIDWQNANVRFGSKHDRM